MTKIHPSAIVHPSAKLGEGVEVGPYTFIGEDVIIGDETWIGSGVIIEKNVKIGARNMIYHHAVIGTPPQHLAWREKETWVRIQDENVIREFVTIHRGYEGDTIIGSKNYLMAYSHVAHDCKIGSRVVITSFSGLSGHTEAQDNVIIGGMSGTHQFVRIGEGAMIGGGSLVGRDVPPYTLAAGSVARLFGLNNTGLKRLGIPREEIELLKKAYKLIFRSGLLMKDAIKELESMNLSQNSEILSKFLEFLKTKSKRGILRETKHARARFEDEG